MWTAIKGLVAGGLTYIVLNVLLGAIVLVFATQQVDMSPLVGFLLVNGAAYLPLVPAGHIAGALAIRARFMSSVSVGLCIAAIAYLFMLVTYGSHGAVAGRDLVWLAIMPIGTSIGGALGLVFGWPAPQGRALGWSRWHLALRIAAQVLVALACGFLLAMMLADAFIPIPGAAVTLFVLCFALLSCSPWFYRFHDASLIVAGVLLGAVATGAAGFMLSPWPVIALTAAAAAVLGYFARVHIMLAASIALPTLLGATCIRCFPIVEGTDVRFVTGFDWESVPLMIAPFAGVLIGGLIRRFRGHGRAA